MIDKTGKTKYYPNIIESVGIVLIFIFLSVVFGTFLAMGVGVESKQQLLTLLAYILAAGGTLLIILRFKKLKHPGEEYFQRHPFRFSTTLVVVVLTFAFIIVLEPITNLIPIPDMYKELLNNLFSKTVPAFITTIIVAPILEELIFRGIMLEGLLRNYNPVKAILITNLFFGLAHLNPWQFAGAFLMGIFISWIYMKTRNILLPVLIHFINNLTSYLFVYFSSKPALETNLKDAIGNNSLYYSIFLISIIVIAGTIFFHKKAIPYYKNGKVI